MRNMILPNNYLSSKYLLLAILFGLLIQPTLLSQSKGFVLNNTEVVQLKNEQTNRDYEVIIFLPDSYEQSKDKKYPVLYLLDGYWHMPLLHSIHGNLVFDNVIPELIIVALSYPGENVKYDQLRVFDLTPTQWGMDPKSTGGGPQFLSFIEKKIIPYIESNYRADSEQRALMGQSLGGLFSLYAMYERPHLFKRLVAVSPAVFWENGYLERKNIEFSKKHRQLNARVFISVSSEEYHSVRDPILKFQKQIEGAKYGNFSLLNYVIKGERHQGGVSEGYNRGLRWIFKDIAPTGPSGLAKFFGN